MNICGCLVHIAPDHTDAARAAMTGTQGVELHAEAEDGRFVVVVEDTAEKLASDTIMDLHQIPGVISLSLTYHHFEDPAETSPQSNAQSQPTSRRPMQ
ncbi:MULTISPECIES: chaperone NapD [unclassified Ruegeria]|uniref:chaperone NapD n=1 Tax=unclassified Ruegeria TaxID=2625375 RepID=UPI001487935C|nr:MULTISPECIES: chaperone NapD [unclassified Ruegeria]NOD36234.1 nitrate reductase [Ruegeria sp. HKCCD7296]NOD47360.1 nitrate reductase [Ruegeria sp. HKCCD5849]NOD53247.1 nitrate reductase [Ruegeria sp. HKCCD5851]NOD66440.1 nitrate reductase [Ruegeria sp. HKCCD7303]NOE34070.1 nitrate reductase [Ruegeria sp. HKCCD7318]